MTLQATLPERDGVSALEIYRRFRGLIVAGYVGAGERLPSVRQTAADLGVSPGTAAKAYKMLEQDGLVVTRTAAGTRVASSAAVLPQAVMRRIRALAEEAASVGAELQDVIEVLRLVAAPPGSGGEARVTVEGREAATKAGMTT